jgi:late competence protein required for DNA uptake (superfamily II DNA/RNA helicase)
MKIEKDCKGCNQVKPVASFVTVYGYSNPRGKYCKDCFKDHQKKHAISLMEGRDFCLYCGTRIEQAYDWYPGGGSKKCYLHNDHMDPLALGGADTEANTVYCCATCNIKKKDLPFTQWLGKLTPEMQKLAQEVYVSKHGGTPDEFSPSSNGVVVTIGLSEIIDGL